MIVLMAFAKPYGELQDISLTTSQLISQLLLVPLGFLALMALCYGLMKLWINYILR
jgi:hypothetical protein